MYGLGLYIDAQPFESAEDALENCNNISEGVLSNTLKLFLEVNIPSVKKLKDSTITLGVVGDLTPGSHCLRSTRRSAKPSKKS